MIISIWKIHHYPPIVILKIEENMKVAILVGCSFSSVFLDDYQIKQPKQP